MLQRLQSSPPAARNKIPRGKLCQAVYGSSSVRRDEIVHTYPMFDAQGEPRQLGRQHGEQCRARILGFLDYIGTTLKLGRAALRTRALRFLPLFQTHCPHLALEIEGLAEGAAVPLADALAVQVRGELAQVQAEGCTTFAVAARGSSGGGVLIGQNSDVEPELEEFAYVLRLQPAQRPAVLMWTFGGQLGYHGLNAAGVAHFANSLGGGPPWRFGLPHYPVKRLMLEQQSLSGVIDLLRRTPVCSSGNYVVCDGAGSVADVELTPDGPVLLDDDGAGFFVHANHFLAAPHAGPVNDRLSVPDSFPRQERMHALVAERFGRLTLADVQRFLADHAGAPTSICRHPHDGPDHPSVSARGRTTASLIAEPGRGLLHITRGNPCATAYQTYRL
jgi:isopenicillin-N N-acyltransferase-like protein